MDAISEFIESKKRCNHREDYVISLEQYLKLFVLGREEWGVEDFTTRHIESWFRIRNEAPTTRASNLGRLSSFFSWAVRNGKRPDNPCDNVERIIIDREPPKILTIADIETLLVRTVKERPKAMLWLVLGIFVGVRPGELQHLKRESVISQCLRGILTIDGAASKLRRRRIIELTSQQKAWIRFAYEIRAELPLTRMNARRRISNFCKWIHLEKWPQDIIRHTALSYQLALTKNADLVAFNAGNSVRVLNTHYKGLILPEDAARFAKLRPCLTIKIK